MSRKRLWDERMAGEEEARRMEMKYASLKEDYMDLQRHTRALRKRARRGTDKKKRLRGEVRFLWRKYQMFTEKDRDEPADSSVSPEFGIKSFSVHKNPKEPTEAVAIEDEPTELQPPATRIMPAFRMPHRLLVTPIVEPTNKNRCLKNNGVVSAQKPSKVKNDRNKKIKATPFVSQECVGEILSISRKPKEPTQEDRHARHELTGLQLFSSTDDCPSLQTTDDCPSLQTTDDCPSPETPSAMETMPAFAVLDSSLVTSIGKAAIKKRLHENNGLVSIDKPSKVKDMPDKKIKVKDSQRKKIKDSPQKPIEERGIRVFGTLII